MGALIPPYLNQAEVSFKLALHSDINELVDHFSDKVFH